MAKPWNTWQTRTPGSLPRIPGRIQRNSSNLGQYGDLFVSPNVINNGVGPAKAEGVELLWQGCPVRTVMELLNACCQPDAAAASTGKAIAGRFAESLPAEKLQTSTIDGSILRAGENRRISNCVAPLTSRSRKSLTALHEVVMHGCYCSVLMNVGAPISGP
jgi:hypothetical protein